MSNKQTGVVDKFASSLEQNTRGNQIAIYTVAGVGLAFALHKVRPVSKFSRVVDVPKHFIRNHEPLRGKIIECEPSIHGTKLLMDHSPLVKIPFWHSNKPPLPVQIWGINLVGGNGVSWLQCIAVGREVTVTPMSGNEHGLIGHVAIHWPVRKPNVTQVTPVNEKNRQKGDEPAIEYLDIAEKLVELGMARVSEDVPKKNINNWWTPWTKELTVNPDDRGYVLQIAQEKARALGNGFWENAPLPSLFQIITEFFKQFIPAKKSSLSAS